MTATNQLLEWIQARQTELAWLTDAEQVVAHLATLEEHEMALQGRLAALTKSVADTEAELAHREQVMQNKVNTAQGTADQLVAAAKKQAEREIAASSTRCQEMLAGATAQRTELVAHVQVLQAEQASLQERIGQMKAEHEAITEQLRGRRKLIDDLNQL